MTERTALGTLSVNTSVEVLRSPPCKQPRTLLPTEPEQPKVHETIEPPSNEQQLELLGVLGEGGFGTVYRARDPFYGEVAVKACDQAAAVAPAAVTAAQKLLLEDVDREAAAHRALQAHATTLAASDGLYVRLHYSTMEPSRALLVMELVPGVMLEEYLEQQPDERLAESESRAIAAHLLQAVAFFHEAGVAHLDIKPKNILIEATGKPRLIDYGSSVCFSPEGSGDVTEQGGVRCCDSITRPSAFAPSRIAVLLL